MRTAPATPTALTKRLAAIGRLDPQEIAVVEADQRLRIQKGAGAVLEREPELPYGVARGWLVRAQTLSEGRRQVLGFLLPGDTINLGRRSVPLVCCQIECLTDVELVDLRAMRARLDMSPASDAIAAAVQEMIAMDDIFRLSDVARLVRQSAMERLSCLLLDLWQRLDAVGLVKDDTFELPLSQVVIAESIGLSSVHVNRIMQKLREAGLIEYRRGRIRLPDPDRLARHAQYCAAAQCHLGLGAECSLQCSASPRAPSRPASGRPAVGG